MPTQIVRAGTTVNFTYDGIGTRIKKAVAGGSTTLYIGVHYEVKDNNVTKYIFGGNLRLAVLKGSLTYYYHKDHLGSTGAITDDTGAKVESAEYHPFGTTREHTGSNVSDYKFTDQELDNETNLYNYDARLYDPVLGMFVTPDNIVPNMFDPQSFNRYSYCRNNPLIYVDPSGHGEVIGGGVPSNGNSDDPDYKGKINETGNKDKVSTPKKTSKSKTKPSVKQKPQQTEEETTGFPLSFDSFIKQAKKVINSMNLTMMTSGEEDQKRQKIAEAIVKGAEVLDKLAPVIEKPTKIDRLKEHLTDDDLDAARRELVGEVVATKSDGTPYDHVTEVREAQTGLVNEIGRINKELSKPDLTQEQRENLTDLLSQASRMLDYTKGFVP
jgi:RHS repeat-associated protein